MKTRKIQGVNSESEPFFVFAFHSGDDSGIGFFQTVGIVCGVG